ncbi:MAG: 4-hydroxy-tetrahydrodipicolinate synthase [Clostridiales bacterium]|jgi:4-hydroxy-tetrahydrodipicolinate synthase|nr:4-hydroxy-tetrahydrodipicolinate synthase [Clostridiales bacterium]
MRSALFYGSGVALVTPFSEGRVDLRSFETLIDWQIDSMTDAIIVLGTTGEPSTISPTERAEMIECAASTVAGRVPLIVGAGSNSTATAILYAQQGQSLGADGLLIVTPYYNKASRRGLIEHFYAIADQVEIPIIVYNVPSRTGVNLEPQVAAELLKHPMLRGVKEASGDIKQMTELCALCSGAALYSGNDDQTYALMTLGARGVISVAANILPGTMHDMAASYLRGDIEMSRELQFATLEIIRALFSEVSPIPVKAALWMMGKIRNEFRLPLSPLDEAKAAKLRAAMEKWNLV